MKFVVESVSKCTARLGSLTKSESLSLATPLFLHYTRGGSIPFISREVLDYVTTEPFGVEISLDSTYHMLKAIAATSGGIQSFAGLGTGMTCLTVKNPGEFCMTVPHEQDVLPVFTRFGRRVISADQYMDYADAYCPDIVHALCDGDTNVSSSKKRALKSAERTEGFFQTCLQRFRASDRLKNSIFIAPIEGGYNIKSRELMIANMLQPEVGGYFLDGFHGNGGSAVSVRMDSIRPIVQRCLELLPNEKMKMMLGAYNPLTTLHLIGMGVDVFDNSFAYLCSVNSCALTFSVNESTTNTFDIDLSDKTYKMDLTAISADCTCLTCKKHTRAYVYHLIETKELLANILLMIHNTHHYIEFFKRIRQTVAANTLPSLIALLERQTNAGCHLEKKIEEIAAACKPTIVSGAKHTFAEQNS